MGAAVKHVFVGLPTLITAVLPCKVPRYTLQRSLLLTSWPTFTSLMAGTWLRLNPCMLELQGGAALVQRQSCIQVEVNGNCTCNPAADLSFC